MNIAEEVELVKKELLELIIDHLKKNKMQPQQAQQLARDFLSILPISDQVDLLNKLRDLGRKYPEAEQVYLEELGKTMDEKRDIVLNKMRDMIHLGNIEGAITEAKILTREPENQSTES